MTVPTKKQGEIWDIVKLAVVLIVAILVIYAIVASATGDDGSIYTRADCIQQWRDSGMLGNVDDMCSRYP